MGGVRRVKRAFLEEDVSSWLTIAEKATRFVAIFMALMLVVSLCRGEQRGDGAGDMASLKRTTTTMMMKRPCDEIYVVREGETLQTISEKCADPYIVEENPHIHDPDDVFPGLVIKITPFKYR